MSQTLLLITICLRHHPSLQVDFLASARLFPFHTVKYSRIYLPRLTLRQRLRCCCAFILPSPRTNMSSSPAFARPADIPRQHMTLPHISVGFEQRLRLSSPRLSSRDFLTLPAPNTATRTQSFTRLGDLRDTVNDINRALESANTAIQDAQDAFFLPDSQSASGHNNMPPLVDLTAASPSQSPELQRHEDAHTSQTPRRHHNSIFTLLNGLPPNYNLHVDHPSVNHSVSGRLPRLRGVFPDYDGDRPSEPNERRHRVVNDRQQLHQHLPEPFAFLAGRSIRIDPQERDQQAIQRQRDARALWESNQRRREALPPHRSRSRSPRQSSPLLRQRPESNSRPGSSGSRVMSETPVESIDLTTVDEKMSANDILAKQREDAIYSQRLSSETGRTSLTSYKCPICMETPADITATICGHLFCHRCIIETLKWSEEQRQENMPHLRAKGVCPVCRKELKRVDTDQKGRTLVPMNLMLGQQIRKRKKTDLKGKGVARDGSVTENKIRESSSEWMGRLVNLEDT